MSTAQSFNRLYTDVSKSIAASMAEIEGLKVEHKDGKQELGKMMNKLRDIQSRFDDELALLEENAEWDKFTMAFFGETNAGKSTIIESLRILFQEETRQELLQKNTQDLAKFEEELLSHVNHVRQSLNKVYGEYRTEMSSIHESTAALTFIIKNESSMRVKVKLWIYASGGALLGGVLVALFTKLFGI